MNDNITKETYDRIAEDWHRDHKSDDWWLEGTNRFCTLLPVGAQILDAGCGAGVKSKYLAGKGFEVTGIDFSEKLIEIARREVEGVDFRIFDMEDASKLGKKFDGIFAQASLLHVPHSKIEKVLMELKSLLRPRGLFYIAVKGKRLGGVDEHVLTESDLGYEYERFFSYYTAGELTAYLEHLHIEIVYHSETRVGKTDWVQLIGKKV